MEYGNSDLFLGKTFANGKRNNETSLGNYETEKQRTDERTNERCSFPDRRCSQVLTIPNPKAVTTLLRTENCKARDEMNE